MVHKSHEYLHHDKLISNDEMDFIKSQLPSDNLVILEKLFQEMRSPDITQERLTIIIEDLNTYVGTMSELGETLQTRLDILKESGNSMKRLHMEELFLDRIHESQHEEDPVIRGFPLAGGIEETPVPVAEKQPDVSTPDPKELVPESATLRAEPVEAPSLGVELSLEDAPIVSEEFELAVELNEGVQDVPVTVVDKTVPVTKDAPVVDTVPKSELVSEAPVEHIRGDEEDAPDMLPEEPVEDPVSVEEEQGDADEDLRDEEAISKQRQVRKDRVQEYIQKDKMGASQINVAEGGDHNAIAEEDEF